MKSIVATVLAALLVAGCSAHRKKSGPLVRIDSRDDGDTQYAMRMEEIERHEKTSTFRCTLEKPRTPVGSSMFMMRGLYEVARARGTEYFTVLKTWDNPDGSWGVIGGFTNTKDANIHEEFGAQFSLTDEEGRAKPFMSVSECEAIWGDE